VIGRGEPSSDASDAAAERIMTRFTGHQAGPVPVASLLYQNYDATAALTAVTIQSHYSGVPRRPAISSTTRFAIGDTDLEGTAIPKGTTPGTRPRTDRLRVRVRYAPMPGTGTCAGDRWWRHQSPGRCPTYSR
jgi:hypothetical protein